MNNKSQHNCSFERGWATKQNKTAHIHVVRRCSSERSWASSALLFWARPGNTTKQNSKHKHSSALLVWARPGKQNKTINIHIIRFCSSERSWARLALLFYKRGRATKQIKTKRNNKHKYSSVLLFRAGLGYSSALLFWANVPAVNGALTLAQALT